MNIRIYWQSIRPEYKWVAQDRYGVVWAFQHEPFRNVALGRWTPSEGENGIPLANADCEVEDWDKRFYNRFGKDRIRISVVV